MSTEEDVNERRRTVDGARMGTLPDNDYHAVSRGRLQEERPLIRPRSDFGVAPRFEARDPRIDMTPTRTSVGSWYRVIIPDDEIADLSARGLMSEYVMAHLAYVVRHGMTDDDGVYHDTHGERGHVYYFSPRASVIGADVLRLYAATACPEPDNLRELHKQEL